MGSVSSIVYSPSRLVDDVLSAGVAVAAGAFYPFNPLYLDGVATLLPFCEPAEIEPFEDFSDVLVDLCNDDESLDVKSRPRTFHTRIQSAVWRGRTVETKRLHQVVAKQVQHKAIRFHRRYRLYGPPDWVDPALSLLPPLSLSPPTFMPNLIPSTFPYAAPHILLSPPPEDTKGSPSVNRLPRQDQAFGNKLIIHVPPSRSGPRPVIFNAAPVKPVVEETHDQIFYEILSDDGDDPSDVPSLIDEDDDASSSVSSACDDLTTSPPTTVRGDSFPENAGAGNSKSPIFWIEEDEDGLPELPDSWC